MLPSASSKKSFDSDVEIVASLKFSLTLLIVVELSGRDTPVLRTLSVEMKRQIFMLLVIDPEALFARMVTMFKIAFCKTSVL